MYVLELRNQPGTRRQSGARTVGIVSGLGGSMLHSFRAAWKGGGAGLRAAAAGSGSGGGVMEGCSVGNPNHPGTALGLKG